MTQIFLRFYVGVLIVLLVAWFIYGFIYEQRTDADVQRVILQAHRGGLAAVIEKLEQNEELANLRADTAIEKSLISADVKLASDKAKAKDVRILKGPKS